MHLIFLLIVLLFASIGNGIKVCGNYCGPGWCAGQEQTESQCVANGSWQSGTTVTGSDNCIDNCCKIHDNSCAAGGQQRVDANKLLAACATGCILNPFDLKLECAETISVTMNAIKGQCCGDQCPVTTAAPPGVTTAKPTTTIPLTTTTNILATTTPKPTGTTTAPSGPGPATTSLATTTTTATTGASTPVTNGPQDCQTNAPIPTKGGNLCRLCCSVSSAGNGNANLKRFRVKLNVDYDAFICDSWEAIMRGRFNAPNLNVCTMARGSVETWVEFPADRAFDVNRTLDAISQGQEAGMGGPVVEMEFGRVASPPGANNGWIAGVVIGVLLAVALIVVGVILVVRHLKKKQEDNKFRASDTYLALNDDIDDSSMTRGNDMETTQNTTFDPRSD